jgi:hypothetical protein
MQSPYPQKKLKPQFTPKPWYTKNRERSIGIILPHTITTELYTDEDKPQVIKTLLPCLYKDKKELNEEEQPILL